MVIKFYYTACIFRSYRGQISTINIFISNKPLLRQTIDIGCSKLILVFRKIDWKCFSLVLKQSSMFICNILYFVNYFIKCFFAKYSKHGSCKHFMLTKFISSTFLHIHSYVPHITENSKAAESGKLHLII